MESCLDKNGQRAYNNSPRSGCMATDVEAWCVVCSRRRSTPQQRSSWGSRRSWRRRPVSWRRGSGSWSPTASDLEPVSHGLLGGAGCYRMCTVQCFMNAVDFMDLFQSMSWLLVTAKQQLKANMNCRLHHLWKWCHLVVLSATNIVLSVGGMARVMYLTITILAMRNRNAMSAMSAGNVTFLLEQVRRTGVPHKWIAP